MHSTFAYKLHRKTKNRHMGNNLRSDSLGKCNLGKY